MFGCEKWRERTAHDDASGSGTGGSDPAKVPVIRNFVSKSRVFYELSDSFLLLKLGS
jgi:hypothetical protein